jgi:hypothetical protein
MKSYKRLPNEPHITSLLYELANRKMSIIFLTQDIGFFVRKIFQFPVIKQQKNVRKMKI